MIIVKLGGGLGNQMFLYAMGRRLSIYHNTNMAFDLRGLYAGEDIRSTFELDVFGVYEQQVDRKHYSIFYRTTIFGSKFLCYLYKKICKIEMIKEKQYTFDSHLVCRSKPNSLIRGLFQTEKYFKNIRNDLLERFKFIHPLNSKNREIKERIELNESVSLHVRRGELANDPEYSKAIGTCSLDYYQLAIDHIKNQVESPTFYVFSDDPKWARKHIAVGEKVEYIDHNIGKESYRDMQLMSLCKHNIIANSTFSWWAAWLNINERKIVIAPKVWCSGWEYDTKDLIPETWLRL